MTSETWDHLEAVVLTCSTRVRTDAPEGVVIPYDTGKRQAQLDRRAWRAKERRTDPKPLSTKTVYRTVLVDVVPAPKKRGGGK